MQDTTGSALALPPPQDLVAIFRAGDQMDAIIKRIEDEARSQHHDVKTAKGREAIASLAHKVARSKTALDAAGADLKAEAQKIVTRVDAERRKIRDRLDALKDEIRKPLTEWEQAEKDRVDALAARLQRLMDAATVAPDATAEGIAAVIKRVEAVALDDAWQEYVAQAGVAKDATLTALRAAHARVETLEAQAAELERLRVQAEAREEDDRKRLEAERVEAERIAQEKAEAERAARIEREKQEAATRAAEEATSRAKAEAEATAKAASEREADLQRQIEDARRATESAAQAERDRAAAQAKAEADAKAKREADAAHRERIKTAIAKALASMAGGATPDAIADAIMAGKIPHVQVML